MIVVLLRGVTYVRRRDMPRTIFFKYKEHLKVKGINMRANVTPSRTADTDSMFSNNSTIDSTLNYGVQGGITFTREQFERLLLTLRGAGGIASRSSVVVPECSCIYC